jgi:tRNA threonylcarbamoyladenosine biosynthesis protein TsaB
MELAIDTASEMASVALSLEGSLSSEITWRCHRNHTVELLPTIDRLLAQSQASLNDLTAVFACTGPGMYTGLRVGISTAKGLARARGVPVIGVGRLELDGYAYSGFTGYIVSVHRAGRGDLAWAAYSSHPFREKHAPRMSKVEELIAALDGPTLLVGEVEEELVEAMQGANVETRTPPVPSVRRAGTLAELGWQRLVAGEPSDPALLVPIYLRPPAIGPQQPSR